MVWRDMGWPAYGSQPQEDDLEPYPKDTPQTGEYRIEVSEASEPGTVVEIRDLLCRLYGKPDECGEQNPYLASYRRLKGTALPRSADSQAHKHIIGIVDYVYWPSLNLGYIESVRVRSDMRQKGLGMTLLNFALDYMRSREIRRIYSFAVNSEGNRLLGSAGFVPEPPDDPERPWRRWFAKT